MADILPPFLTIADDLSGAAECASALVRYGAAASVHLRSATNSDRNPAMLGHVVLDANLRSAGASEHARRLDNELVTHSAHFAQVVLKVDSALRGRIGTAIAVAARHGPTLVATALPSIGRASIDGKVVSHDAELAHVTAHGEESAPASVLDVLPPDSHHHHISLENVRNERLSGIVERSLAATNSVVTCDAETDDDLDRIVKAIPSSAGTVLIGSAGLVAALARAEPALRTPEPQSVPIDDPPGPRLILVGSRSSAAQSQVHALTLAESDVLLLRADTSNIDAIVDAVTTRIAVHTVTVTVEDGDGDPRRIVRALAKIAASVPSFVPLVTIGGQTARAVADELGILRFRIRGELDYGATVCESDTGRTVIIRPGSFGKTESLISLAAHPHLRAEAPK